MADDRMAVMETLREEITEGDVDVVREGMSALGESQDDRRAAHGIT